MAKGFVVRRPLPEFGLWEKMADGRAVFSFDLEATARCNLDCRHCYINRPAGDRAARKRELGVDEIGRIGAEAAALGAVWCLLTGGEPLLRPDFFELYQALLSKGLLISLFTNATLVGDEHVRFFRKFPPRDIEVTVYGVTRETYERVTRTPGSFDAFLRGLDRLLAGGITVRLKAMALRSNKHELAAIGDFCRARTKDYYRFDPQLHLRFDRDESRNTLIRAERLSPREVVRLERADPERFGALEAACGEILPAPPAEGARVPECRHIFRCGVGQRSFVVGPEGHAAAVPVAEPSGFPLRPQERQPGRRLDRIPAGGAAAGVRQAGIPGEVRAVPDRQPLPLVPGPRLSRDRGARPARRGLLPGGGGPGGGPKIRLTLPFVRLNILSRKRLWRIRGHEKEVAIRPSSSCSSRGVRRRPCCAIASTRRPRPWRPITTRTTARRIPSAVRRASTSSTRPDRAPVPDPSFR